MYISKVIPENNSYYLNLYNNQNRINNEHQLIWLLFNYNRDMDRDFIYQKKQTGEHTEFIVVSHRRPINVKGLKVITKNYDPKITTGERFKFNIEINPTIRSVKTKNKVSVWDYYYLQLFDKGCSQDQIKEKREEKVKDWAIAKMEKYGMTIEELEIESRYKYHINKSKNMFSSKIVYDVISFVGILRVTNIKEFQEALFDGIGRCKGFGCGLLLVRRL